MIEAVLAFIIAALLSAALLFFSKAMRDGNLSDLFRTLTAILALLLVGVGASVAQSFGLL